MARRKRAGGFLTERQLEVLKLRRQGLSYDDIAKAFKTTKENILILEKRALRNIKLSRETLEAAASLAGERLVVPSGARLVDVPAMVLDKANSSGIKLSMSMGALMAELGGRLRELVRGGVLSRDVEILIMPDGEIAVLAPEG